MNQKKILKSVEKTVRAALDGDGTGHDFWHVDRVRKVALQIAKKEKADRFVVELGALLHDVADWKVHGGDFSAGPKRTREILEALKVPEEIILHVSEIVGTVSFKGESDRTTPPSLEGKIVQDADRMDALGAIGIARTFAYGGSKGRPIHDPNEKPIRNASVKQYTAKMVSGINHFYEKLLLLKDRMNTKTGRRIATQRHRFLVEYLRHFHREWKGDG